MARMMRKSNREVDVVRCAMASVGRLAAGSPRLQSRAEVLGTIASASRCVEHPRNRCGHDSPSAPARTRHCLRPGDGGRAAGRPPRMEAERGADLRLGDLSSNAHLIPNSDAQHENQAHFQGIDTKNPPIWRAFLDGASRTRTGDLLGAIQALSQLSYSPGRRHNAARLRDSLAPDRRPSLATRPVPARPTGRFRANGR